MVMKIITNFFLVIQLILLGIIGLCVVIMILRSFIIYLINVFVKIKQSLIIYLIKIHRSCIKITSMNFKNLLS
jgi:hypothetical protein